jgi:hypothetical protein
VLPGVPADHTFTFEVRAYRRVDKDVAAEGVILSPPITTPGYQPATAPVYLGDIQGTIQGRNSLDVVQNLEYIASDAVLSTTEKPALILSYNQAISDWSALDAKAASLNSFQAERDAAAAAKTALVDYLTGLVPAWNDTAVHTPIDAAVFQSKWASLYSALADLQAAITGQKGADAITLIVVSDRQTVAFDAFDQVLPNQDITIKANKQNTTAAVTWTIKDATGVNVSNPSTYLTGDGDQVVMTVAQFESARGSSNGVIVTGSMSVGGVTITDSISILKVKDGSQGDPGVPGMSIREVTVFMRSANQPATPTGGTYDFGTGVLTPPTGWSATIPTGANPIWAARGDVAIQGITGTAAPTWLGVGVLAQDGAAVNIIFTRSATQPAAPAASTGLPANWYESIDTLPAGANPVWASFGTRPDSQSKYTWQTPVRQQGIDGAPGEPGADGPAGPTIGLSADDISFDFIDGYPMNSAQVITLTATKQNTTESLNWAVTPSVPLGTVAGDDTKRTLSLTDFGTNNQVVITVTGATSGARAAVTLIRNNQTTPTDSIIPDSQWRGGVGSVGQPWRVDSGLWDRTNAL